MSSISGNYNNYMNQQAVSSLMGGRSAGLGSSDLLSQLSGLKGSSASSASYGTNTSGSSDELLSYVSDLKNGSGAIQDALKKLVGEGKSSGSAFSEGYKATSSDKTAVDATFDGKDNVGVSTDPVAVKVERLATTQKNEGTAMEANGNSFGANKYFEFEIEVDGQKSNISLATDPSDNNKSVQQKMADKINEKNIGVKASVEFDKITQTSKLVVESKKTGIDVTQDNVFKITDKSGNAAALTGANNVTQAAQNAVYLVGEVDKDKSKDGNVVLKGDAQRKTSKSNTDVALNDDIKLNLNKTTDKFVSIGVKNDGAKAIDAARKLVNGFNALYDAASNQEGNGAARLERELSGNARSYAKALEQIGVSRDSSGYLTIDDKKMEEASNNGKLEEFFNDDKGENFGFANKLKQTATKVEKSPYQYVADGNGKELETDSNPYQQSSKTDTQNYSMLFRMQKYENVGFLFNSMF